MRAENARRAFLHLEVKRNPRSDLGQMGNGFLSDRRRLIILLFPWAGCCVRFKWRIGHAYKVLILTPCWSLKNTFLKYKPYIFGDHPVMAKSETGNPGTNLQDEPRAENTFLAGMEWPYRQSWDLQKNRIRKRGGFSGLTINTETQTMYAILEKPLVGEEKEDKTLSFDMKERQWHKDIFTYELEPEGTAVDALVWIGGVRFSGFRT